LTRPLSAGSLAAILLLSSAPPCGAEWPQFRGPGGLGVSAERDLPTEWSDEEGVLWKAPLPGAGASSPVVRAGRVYVTAYTGYGVERPGEGRMDDLRLHIIAIDGKDGREIWKRDIRPRLPESDRVRDHGYAAPTPALDDSHLYVFFGRSGVFKLDLEGEIVWNVHVGDRTHGWGCGTSPVLHENLVIVNASVESGSLVALDRDSGKEVWRAGGMRESWNTPHLVELEGGKKELVVSVQRHLLAFDPRSGKELWRSRGIDDYVCPSIVSHAGIVYAVGGRQSRCLAVRAGGRGDVSDTHVLWDARAGANVSSPVIHEGHLYGVSDRTQTAYCVRLEDGEVVYSTRVRGQPYASALAAGGKIYVVLRQGGTLVIAARPSFEIIAHNRLEDRSYFNASPAAAGGRLFLRSDRYLYSIGAAAAGSGAGGG
jgi:outer membrane protein assembly factor BamB